MKEIKGIFVRHGLSEANVGGVLVGDTDVPLADEGRIALKEIKETIDFPETDKYFSSNMKRAKETAQILFPEKKINERAGFRELNFGDLEGKLFKDIDIIEIFRIWCLGEELVGAETYDIFRERVSNAIDDTLSELVADGLSSFTLVSHSCTMRAIKSYLDNSDRYHFMDFNPKNGEVYEADISYDEIKKEIVKVDFKSYEKSLDLLT